MSKHRNGFFLKLTKPHYSFTLEQKFGIGKILKIIYFFLVLMSFMSTMKGGNVYLTACVCQEEHDFSEQHMILLNHTLTKLKTQGFAITELLKAFFKLSTQTNGSM